MMSHTRFSNNRLAEPTNRRAVKPWLRECRQRAAFALLIGAIVAGCNGGVPEPPRTEAPPLGPAPDPPIHALAPTAPSQPAVEEEPPWQREEFFRESQELRMFVLGAVDRYLAERHPITLSDEEVRAALEEEIPPYTDEEMREVRQRARERIAEHEAMLAEIDAMDEVDEETQGLAMRLRRELEWMIGSFPESREAIIENSMETYRSVLTRRRINEIALGEDLDAVEQDPYRYFALEERRLQIAKQMIKEEHPLLEGFLQEDIDPLIERNRAMRDEWAAWDRSGHGPAPILPFY